MSARERPRVRITRRLSEATLERARRGYDPPGFRALDDPDAFFAGREPRDRLV